MLKGVIEGFYGRLWTRAERLEMMNWIQAASMNLYVYAPKDDIKVRASWRENYDEAELARLRDLVTEAGKRGLEIMAGISPCLDITHSDSKELATLNRRLDQFTDLGIRHITLLFDDIPSTLNEADRKAFKSFADAHVHVVNTCKAHLDRTSRDTKLYFCPTDYCGAFVQHDLKGSSYLNTIGTGLDPAVEIMWTGPDIVSRTIDLPHVLEIGAVLRRKPFIWDNFHANDYDIRRVYAGPLGGRDPAILPHVAGWVTNPNNEFEANFVAVHSTGRFLRVPSYDQEQALHEAISAWQYRFARSGNGFESREPVPLHQISLLCEIFHQPFSCGPEIEQLLSALRDMFREQRPDTSTAKWKTALAHLASIERRAQDLFDAMTELTNRDLFYAFHQYIWEARHELRHLLTYAQWLDGNPPAGVEFPHESRIYNFYRMGFTAALNDLVQRDRQGRFRHGT